jgi:hypothetical protein
VKQFIVALQSRNYGHSSKDKCLFH